MFRSNGSSHWYYHNMPSSTSPINTTTTTWNNNFTILLSSTPPPQIPPNKVFICITRQVNRLILQPKYDSIFQPILNAGFDIDVALVLTDGPVYFTNGVNATTPLPNPEFPTYQDAVQYLKSLNTVDDNEDHHPHGHHFRRITVLTTQPFPNNPHPKVPYHYLKSLDNYFNFTEQRLLLRGQNHARIFESLHQCYTVMTARGSHHHYELILRIRDDMAMDPPLHFPTAYSMLYQPTSRPLLANCTIFVPYCRCYGGINDRLAVLHPDAAKAYFTSPHLRFQTATNTTILEPNCGYEIREKFLFDTYHTQQTIAVDCHTTITGSLQI